MKKRIYFFIAALLCLSLIIFSSSLLSAQITGIGSSSPDEIKQSAIDYLNQKWDSFLEQSNLGKFVLDMAGIFQALSPIFKLIIGIEYSLSWMFFLSLFIWIIIFIMIQKGIKPIFPDKFWISLLVPLLILSISAQFQIIQKGLEFLSPLVTDTANIFIFVIVILILFILYSLLIRYIARAQKKEVKKRREEKAKLAEKLHDIEIKASGGKK